jgi:hypothetical protein
MAGDYAAIRYASMDSKLVLVILGSCRIIALRIYSSGSVEMEKEEIIGILKRLLGEEDIDFLRKLDEDELIRLLVIVRDKIGLPKGLH